MQPKVLYALVNKVVHHKMESVCVKK